MNWQISSNWSISRSSCLQRKKLVWISVVYDRWKLSSGGRLQKRTKGFKRAQEFSIEFAAMRFDWGQLQSEETERQNDIVCNLVESGATESYKTWNSSWRSAQIWRYTSWTVSANVFLLLTNAREGSEVSVMCELLGMCLRTRMAISESSTKLISGSNGTMGLPVITSPL